MSFANRRTNRVSVILWGLLFLIFLLVGPAEAEVSGEQEVTGFLVDLQRASDRVDSLQSNFEQVKKLSLFQKPVHFSGRLLVDRPDKLRWEFISPVPSALIFNGDKGIRCSDGEMSQTFDLATDPVMKTVAEQLWLWLGGDFTSLGNQYDLQKTAENGLVLSPLGDNSAPFFESITIDFDKESLQPLMIRIDEKKGDRTEISFTDMTTNKEIPSHLFTDCKRDD